MIDRIIEIQALSRRKSLFLLGPRSTGKSSFIKSTFPNATTINFLKNSELLRYKSTPDLLLKEFENKEPQLIIIDEIQMLPELLNNVHYLIEESKHRFILTGSSARKLRKQGVNLLDGRASSIQFHPFVLKELGERFDLMRVINFGSIPPIYLSEEPDSDLKDYVGTYLKEEIMAESLVRNLPAFSRFLEVAAACNGKMLNYTKVSNDAAVPVSTVVEYFKLLEDTLVGNSLRALNSTVKRKAIQTSKFYFFDTGVVRTLLNVPQIFERGKDFGDFFEAYIHHELNTFTHYKRLAPLKYWRCASGYEVDFILNDKIAIEVKSTKRITGDDLKGLKALKEENVCSEFYLISQDDKEQDWDGIKCVPYQSFLEQLWSQE